MLDWLGTRMVWPQAAVRLVIILHGTSSTTLNLNIVKKKNAGRCDWG